MLMFEVPVRLSPRAQFSKDQKWMLLLEYDKCLDRGAKAAFCRAVGVHPRTAREWADARLDGRLRPPAPEKPTGSGTGWMNNRERDELNRLRKENEKLRAKLEKSEAAVDILGKASALLDALARSATATDPHLENPVPGRPDWLKGPEKAPRTSPDTSAD